MAVIGFHLINFIFSTNHPAIFFWVRKKNSITVESSKPVRVHVVYKTLASHPYASSMDSRINLKSHKTSIGAGKTPSIAMKALAPVPIDGKFT